MASGQRALILGCSTFLGEALRSALRARGWMVRATAARARDDCEALDVSDEAAVGRAVAGADAVFFLAAVRNRPLAELGIAARVNVLGVANALGAAARVGAAAPPVVLAGSAEEYGLPQRVPTREDDSARPTSAYGVTKLAATQMAVAAAEAGAVPAVVLRPAVIYGPGAPAHMLVANAARAVREDSACVLNGGGEQTRDFVFVEDVAEAFCQAAEAARGAARGAVINVASGEERTIRSVAERVIAVGGRGRLEVGPASTRAGDVARNALDVSRARELLGWSARTNLDAGIVRTLRG